MFESSWKFNEIRPRPRSKHLSAGFLHIVGEEFSVVKDLKSTLTQVSSVSDTKEGENVIKDAWKSLRFWVRELLIAFLHVLSENFHFYLNPFKAQSKIDLHESFVRRRYRWWDLWRLGKFGKNSFCCVKESLWERFVVKKNCFENTKLVFKIIRKKPLEENLKL